MIPSADHWIDVNAGPDGRFELKRLKPGRWNVAQGIPFSPGGRPYPSHNQGANIAPGETVTITIGGGTGRTVVGRVEIPTLDPPPAGSLAFLQNDWSTPNLTPPATYGEVQAMTQSDREALADSVEFRAYADATAGDADRRRFHAFTVNADGTFRIEDVTPGEYRHFYVEVRQPGDGGARFEVERSIVVPPAGEGDETPIDMGTLPLRRVVNLAVGDEMPDVAFVTVEGEEKRLSDFRSQYVLLDAWATWCGPCVGETPNIKAVQDAYAGDERLAIVGLSMDDSPEAPRRYAQAEGLTWTNGFIGQAETTDVDDQLGIGGIPDIRLIGPDGRLLARGLRGAEIRAAVDKALAEQSPADPAAQQ